MKNKILTITAIIVMIVMMVSNVGMFLGMKKALKDAKNDRTIAANQELSGDVNNDLSGDSIEDVINDSKENNVSTSEDNDKESDKADKDEITFTREELLSYFKKDGEGTIGLLRDKFPEYIVYIDDEYKFVKVIDSIAKNDWKSKNLKVDEDGEITYEEDGKVVSHKGIDVSKYQGEIDWNKVKADGVEYAMIRIGYRGYGTGKIVTDEQAITNIKNATKAGIKVGVYFFSQAINEKEAKEEAEYIVDIIKDYKIEYPIVFDMEEIAGDTSRTDNLTKEQKTDIAIAFCERVKEAEYTPMIYANIKWFASHFDLERIEGYDKWFAYYDDTLYFPYKIKMWQYTDSGKVDGIAGNVDLNIYVE